MGRSYQSKNLFFLVFVFLLLSCSQTSTISQEQAKDIVETSTHILFQDKKIPFSVFHAHDGMYRWVVKLQRDFPNISNKTTIINIDMHSDAYGSRLKSNSLPDYRNLKGLNLGNWMRFLHVNGICSGKKVLISHANLIWQMKVDRCAYLENDIFIPNSDYDDNWIYNDYLFNDLNDLKNSNISGPAIVTVDYDYLASIDNEISREWIRNGARKIAQVIFTGKIVPVAVNFTYSDRFDKRSESQPFIHTSIRDYVSKCMVQAFSGAGAVFERKR